MNNKIKFSKNWNKKLDNPYFTTIRLYNDEKCKYYCDQLDKLVSSPSKVFDVIVRDEKVFEARLVDLEVRLLKDIPDWLCRIDAELDEFVFGQLMESMYGKKSEWNGQYTKFIILCFKKIKSNETEKEKNIK